MRELAQRRRSLRMTAGVGIRMLAWRFNAIPAGSRAVARPGPSLAQRRRSLRMTARERARATAALAQDDVGGGLSADGVDEVGEHAVGGGFDARIGFDDGQAWKNVSFEVNSGRSAGDCAQRIAQGNLLRANTGFDSR